MADIPYSEMGAVGFFISGSEDNYVESSVTVTNDESFHNELPVPNGINDAHMGSVRYTYKCKSCQYDKTYCPGHPGVAELNYPVVSPMCVKEIQKWLKVVCFNCGQLVITSSPPSNIKREKILDEYVKLARSSKIIQCPNPDCKAIHPSIRKNEDDDFSIDIEDPTIEPKKGEPPGPKWRYFYPHEIEAVLNKITPETCERLGKKLVSHPKKFILRWFRVPPTTIRPEIQKMSGGRTGTNDLTIIIASIIKVNKEIPPQLKSVTDVKTISDKQQDKIKILNMHVYDLIKGTSSTSKLHLESSASKRAPMSICKRFPRKFGRIRRNLLGRRANHMARSVITCDPSLRINEIGLPKSIARDIPIPEVVREYNYEQMRIYFMNGVKRYPGCVRIKKASTGAFHDMSRISSDITLEIGDIIYRNMITGDIVNFNRQPSLEPSNISSMRVVVMDKGETIRMNVLVCSFFNADFDGDAMNVLVPRSKRTMHEISMLNSPSQFFISYKNGRPKIGEVQDSLFGSARLTQHDVTLDRFHAMQIFSQVKIYHDFSQYPADKVFTGRELVSILFREMDVLINFNRTPSVYDEKHALFRKYDPSDIKVEIDRGELKSGILDKASIGEESHGGVFHIIHNKYSPERALEVSFNLQQLAISYIYNRGATIDVGDLLVRPEKIAEIQKVEMALIASSEQITEKLNKGEIIPSIGKTVTEYYEEMQTNALRPEDAIWEHIMSGIDHDRNNLFNFIITGARGKLFNFKNISTAIGQMEINGERMREIFGGRTAPYFMRDDPDPHSRGYIGNSYISGIDPTEFIFHAQEARYAIISKALSTSITGMHNRMSIKNLEAMHVDNHRKIVNDGRVVQLLYGGDGCDPRFIENVRFLTMEKGMSREDFAKRFRATTDLFTDKAYKNKDVQRLLDEEFAQLQKDREFYTKTYVNIETVTGRLYSDMATMPVNIHRIIEDVSYSFQLKKHFNEGRWKLDPVESIKKVRDLCENIAFALLNKYKERDAREAKGKGGVRAEQKFIPEYMETSVILLRILIRSYLNVRTLISNHITDETLDVIINRIRETYEKSLISYGKSVGIIAAQAISEPMTQLVLDSHHHSGAASTKKKGLFRIREILSARPTERMKSPSMVLFVKPEYADNKDKVQEIATNIEMLSVRHFLQDWQIFFEKYGDPVHPAYKHEKKLIAEFEKYNPHVKPPADLSNWCIRIGLDKEKMIEKKMRIENIYHKLRQFFPQTFIVYSADNTEQIVLRIYPLQSMLTTKKGINTERMIELTESIFSRVVRGVPDIHAAYVKELKQHSVIDEEGRVVNKPVYYIFTDGTNLKAILENPYIDHSTAQSDSIVETAEVYGIAAAQTKIISEMKHQVEGSSHRHYMLYADEMVYNGVVTSIDRYGSAKREANFMLRISDASPIAVIQDSAINAAVDNLRGVSPPIMMGKNPQIGDLFNTFVLDEDFVHESLQSVEQLL